MKFSIRVFFSKIEQLRRKLHIRSYLLKKFLLESFCAVNFPFYSSHVIPTVLQQYTSLFQQSTKIRPQPYYVHCDSLMVILIFSWEVLHVDGNYVHYLAVEFFNYDIIVVGWFRRVFS